MGGPSETRSDRLAVRRNGGKRDACHDVRRRVSEGPPVSPALHTRRSGRGVVHRRTLGELTDDPGRTQACRMKVGGPQSLPVAPESLATRGVDPTLSTAERAGGVGGALGHPSSYGRDRRIGNRQAGGGPDSPIGFLKAPPAPPARWIGGDWVAITSN